ncbi:LD-carboxypeptidase [Altererythrobacter confluentis]|uniref:LD-carboxypeptidase n=1 Tax=Allopontixanthobacter confluentis TaxID=1849021 RepID=A0A6L7GE21_9SPHN|nr:LD-carboxypeptidase [Allopontixanthobacter confluentis]MXP14332.1 LD-carboxypeptidase [Allopontixanthobacter confluentis]
MTRIAICAPGKRLEREDADAVQELVASEADIELYFHPQCFARHGHFAGCDDERLAAFVDCANAPSFDAVWFANGGYGSNRIAADCLGQLGAAAKAKRYLGYSDTGYLLAALYKAGIGQPAHGPMVGDIRREYGNTAIRRALDWMAGGVDGLEPGLHQGPDQGQNGAPAAAFNLMTLAMLCGTDLQPDLAGHVVMVEEVAEHLYAVDRLFFHITQHLKGIAGLRLGRISDVPENDRPFGASDVEIAEYWCAKAGIAFLGRADIGHDAANRIVPFGLAGRGQHT